MESECLCVETTGPRTIENLISAVYGSERHAQSIQSVIQDFPKNQAVHYQHFN